MPSREPRPDEPRPAVSPAAPRVGYVTDVARLPGLPAAERAHLARVAERYVFRVNDYYLSLIDWNDPRDPIRQLVVPREEELRDFGNLDPIGERATAVGRGLQHKYRDTVVIVCSDTCGAYCRYCCRKRLFMEGNDETARDVREGLAYVAAHAEVNNVLLTGGDPLMLATRRLAEILRGLRAIPHVRIVRLGTKVPAFDPHRILRDRALQAALREHSRADARLYVAAHFDHPRELTPAAVAAIAALVESGVVCVNQCPIIRGVNDDPEVLAELFERLSFVGCPQYYVFQCQPTAGNEAYEVPLVRSFTIFQEATARGSGLARRARFVMSHASGKVEVLAIDDRRVYLRYQQARRAEDAGRFFVRRRDDAAYWLDQLEPLAGEAG
jgi:lysine 2,3-aminomutase